MASATVQGGGGGRSGTISSTTATLQAAAQSALDAITARVAAGTDDAVTYSGSGAVPKVALPAELLIGSAASLTIPSSMVVDAIVDTAQAPVSVTDDTSTPVTVLSGSGGLTFNRTASGDGAAFIIATGGSNSINLGSGAATVGADGAATITALGGAASVVAGAGGSALVAVAGADTVSLLGTDTVAFAAAAAARVTAQDGSNVVFTSQAGSPTPIVQLAPGTETLGTTAGSTATVAGSAGGMLLVSAWGGRTFIDPAAANVTVFAGSGSETLFGAGDESLPGVAVPAGTGPLANTGSDFVFGGQGYFHGGSGALNLLISSTIAGAATLVGGGSIDLLFSQGAGDSMRGAPGTVIINAAGFSEPGFSVAGAAAGNVLDAGASNAFMFGSAWGSNTIMSGSGSSTVFGNHGATGQVGNVYVDGGAAGTLSILDFLPGADVVSLRGDTVTKVASVAAGQGGTPGTFVSLGDGTTIAFVDQFLTQSQLGTMFR